MVADASRDILLQVSESVRYYIEMLREGGMTGVPRAGRIAQEKIGKLQHGESGMVRESPSSLAPKMPEVANPWAPSSSENPQASASHGLAMQSDDLFLPTKVPAVQSLEELRAEIGDCRRCKLCQGRTQIVFGVGNPRSELVFVGEGPGRDEDLQGEPFVGRAGQLLTEIITKGMKMRREDVYICNVVKCRPPENRNPEPDEIAACEPFLVKQLELIQPRWIVALGAFAAQTLLKTKTPISRLRGNWHSYRGIQLMPTLHPAYLLRNPADKRLVWQDIQAVLREMGRL
jgi:DNA polymerase